MELVDRFLAKFPDENATTLQERWGISASYISGWRRGTRPGKRLNPVTVGALRRALDGENWARRDRERLSEAPAKNATSRGAVGWPEGWRERAYRLQADAVESGATDDEVRVVMGWMLSPDLQALWSGGPPKDLSELEGIEVGARAWLRARGKKVKAK